MNCRILYYAPKALEKFYLKLGCKRLGNVIEEKYTPDGAEMETDEQKNRGKEIRDSVLERLLLFVPTFDDQKLQEQYKWMQEDGNFVVGVYKRLRLTRTLKFGSDEHKKTCGDSEHIKTCSVSCGYWTENGSFKLLLTTKKPNDFE